LKIQYITNRFKENSQHLIKIANQIIEEYQAQGYSLTLRQLYYQFVARDYIENSQKSYKNLGSLVNDARLAGLIDWWAIEDRTRNLRGNSHWDSPADMIKTCENQFAYDKWADQPYAPEVWIEKDALIGVIEGPCNSLDVPYFACRGYSSQSEQWRAGRRFKRALERGQIPIVFHLGDHDPSGIDMTRDNKTRLSMFAGLEIHLKRLALNYDQVEEYNPPPNPAKLTDSRCKNYIQRFGKSSWELDALNPQVISRLIEEAILNIRDDNKWNDTVNKEGLVKDRLRVFREELEKEDE
jgi:hypothetical protein